MFVYVQKGRQHSEHWS